jgi:hypothetical protein
MGSGSQLCSQMCAVDQQSVRNQKTAADGGAENAQLLTSQLQRLMSSISRTSSMWLKTGMCHMCSATLKEKVCQGSEYEIPVIQSSCPNVRQQPNISTSMMAVPHHTPLTVCERWDPPQPVAHEAGAGVARWYLHCAIPTFLSCSHARARSRGHICAQNSAHTSNQHDVLCES